MLYAPYAQDPWPFMDIAVRTAQEPRGVAPDVERAIQAVDKDEPVYNIRTMDEVVSRSLSSRSFNLVLLGSFAALALFLTAIGVFGLISFAVAQRRHEIGVRMALGAQPAGIFSLIVGQGLRLSAVGIAGGLIAAFALTRLMATMLVGIKPTDPATFVTMAALFFLIAGVASWLPARRAAALDPVDALRAE